MSSILPALALLLATSEAGEYYCEGKGKTIGIVETARLGDSLYPYIVLRREALFTVLKKKGIECVKGTADFPVDATVKLTVDDNPDPLDLLEDAYHDKVEAETREMIEGLIIRIDK